MRDAKDAPEPNIARLHEYTERIYVSLEDMPAADCMMIVVHLAAWIIFESTDDRSKKSLDGHSDFLARHLKDVLRHMKSDWEKLQ